MRKKLTGIVLSDKMEKTLVIGVETIKIHPIYHKRIRRVKKYYVHDADSIAKEGDKVEVIETRPISKTKRWILSQVIDE